MTERMSDERLFELERTELEPIAAEFYRAFKAERSRAEASEHNFAVQVDVTDELHSKVAELEAERDKLRGINKGLLADLDRVEKENE